MSKLPEADEDDFQQFDSFLHFFLVAHAGCLTVRLTERSTVRLTGSLFVTVRLTERSTMRLTVRQRVHPSVRQGVRHDRIRLILIKYGLFWAK